jgi:hypothetical protein
MGAFGTRVPVNSYMVNWGDWKGYFMFWRFLAMRFLLARKGQR